MSPQRLAVAVALGSAAVLSLGVGLIYLPAGLIAAGLQGLAMAYLVAFFGRAR